MKSNEQCAFYKQNTTGTVCEEYSFEWNKVRRDVKESISQRFHVSRLGMQFNKCAAEFHNRFVQVSFENRNLAGW